MWLLVQQLEGEKMNLFDFERSDVVHTRVLAQQTQIKFYM